MLICNTISIAHTGNKDMNHLRAFTPAGLYLHSDLLATDKLQALCTLIFCRHVTFILLILFLSNQDSTEEKY